MMTTRLLAMLAATLIAAPLSAQPAATTASAAEIAALTERAAREIKPGQPLLALPVMGVGPWRAMLEYRQAGAPASLHKTQIEIFQVVSGAGQFVTGGTLEGTRDVDAANQSGTGIAGGSSRRVATGDIMAVPAGVPHWIPSVEGRLVLISLKVPTP
ncbi:MAG: cupin domain-containing protein [Sandarakinorhabdus sp.]|jgi:mannose-6-phosphate isomerase-like protein (cupin superfamily)